MRVRACYAVARTLSRERRRMRKEGLEPPYPFGYQILSLARLPVPPLSRVRSVARTPLAAASVEIRESSRESHAVRRCPRAVGLALAILVVTRASLAWTFEMMNSSTTPRAEARELMARRAGTRVIFSCARRASAAP